MNNKNMQCHVDLHLHLDGSLPQDIVRKLAAQQDIPLEMSDAELKKVLTVPLECKDLNEYLTKFDFPLKLMQTEEALEESIYSLLCRLDRQGLMYCEVRFAPQLHTRQGLSQEQVVKAVLRGLAKVEESSEYTIRAGIILCCMRGDDNEVANSATVELAGKYLGKGVCGVDLAGAEALYPTMQFAELFERARELKIPITIHAGEAAGAESVEQAVNMGAVRIGHGIHAIEDKRVLELLRKYNIMLELCPTSNLNTKAVGSLKEYPIMEFIQSGVEVTVNTDNMTVSDTTIQKEFERLKEVFEIKDDLYKQLLYNSVEAAFTTEAVKEQLRERIERELFVDNKGR